MCMAVISFTSEKLPFFPVLKDVHYFVCVIEIPVEDGHYRLSYGEVALRNGHLTTKTLASEY